MLGNGGDKLLSAEDLEVGPVLAVGHLGAIDDGAGLFLVAHLLQRELIPDNMLGQAFPALCVVPRQLHTVMYAEARSVPPAHDLGYQFVTDFPTLFQHLEHGGAKELLQGLQVDPRQ